MSAIEQRRTSSDRDRRETAVSDGTPPVAAAARSRLQQCPYPEVHRVVCEFREGVLTLSGTVASYHIKQIAQSVLAGMEGVAQVDNRLDVMSWSDSA